MPLSYSLFHNDVLKTILPLTQDPKRTYLPFAATCWMSIWKVKPRRSVSELLPFPPTLRAVWPTSCLPKALAT